VGPTASPTACRPTDQDRYVYNPTRLKVLAACRRVTGTVEIVRIEADGDLHILVRLDAADRSMPTPANANEQGDLVVEPVCVRSVSQADAVVVCRADPDPLQSLPTVGMRVALEGRYVLDTEHGDWAELHPLYRWIPLTGRAPAAPTPGPAPAGKLSVRFSELTPTAPGGEATATVSTAPGASCSIEVVYRSGPSTASGLTPKTASSTGAASWTWQVGSRTTPGSWPVTVTCTLGSAHASATGQLVVT
jgi:hypothetical protein